MHVLRQRKETSEASVGAEQGSKVEMSKGGGGRSVERRGEVIGKQWQDGQLFGGTKSNVG